LPNSQAVGCGEHVSPGEEVLSPTSAATTRRPAACALDGGRELRGDGDGNVEQRAGRGAHDLGVVGIDRASGQHDGVGTGGVGGADDGAEVAGVAHLLADRDEASAMRRRCP
jgi:hypothetical protein